MGKHKENHLYLTKYEIVLEAAGDNNKTKSFKAFFVPVSEYFMPIE